MVGVLCEAVWFAPFWAVRFDALEADSFTVWDAMWFAPFEAV